MLSEISSILKDQYLSKKIRIYMSTKSIGNDFDSYEANYTFSNLNPYFISGYVRELTPESAFYKEYGIHKSGTKEFLCEDKYENYFLNANKIEIDNIEYQVLKSATGNRVLLTHRPFGILRVILSRAG